MNSSSGGEGASNQKKNKKNRKNKKDKKDKKEKEKNPSTVDTQTHPLLPSPQEEATHGNVDTTATAAATDMHAVLQDYAAAAAAAEAMEKHEKDKSSKTCLDVVTPYRPLLARAASFLMFSVFAALLYVFYLSQMEPPQHVTFSNIHPYHVPLIVDLVSVNGRNHFVTVNVEIEIAKLSPQLRSGVNRLKMPVYVMLGRNEIHFHNQTIPAPVQVKIPIDDGDIVMYPWDRYNVNVDLFASDDRDFGDSDLDFSVTMKASHVYGYHAVFKLSKGEFSTQERGYKEISMDLYHPPMFLVYPMFVFLGLWSIGIGFAIIGWHVAIWEDTPMDGKYLTMSSGLLFAIPRFRMSIPLSPPFGCLLDYAAFFWCQFVCVAVFTAMMIRTVIPYWDGTYDRSRWKQKDGKVGGGGDDTKSSPDCTPCPSPFTVKRFGSYSDSSKGPVRNRAIY